MPRGGFGGGFGRGFGGGFGMRRMGPPIVIRGGGMGGLGGGLGMGGGSPLLTSLMAGGLGYLFGSRSGQSAEEQQQGQAPPPYPAVPPYYQAPPAAVQGPTASTEVGTLAQLKLLGELHDAGILTDEEFASEKQRILGRE